MAAEERKPEDLRSMARVAPPVVRASLNFVAELFEMAADDKYSNEMIGIRVRNQLNHL
jgi:hypothetical protein